MTQPDRQPDVPLSEVQLQALQHEAFIQRVLTARESGKKSEGWLDRPGPVAILGGIVGFLGGCMTPLLSSWITLRAEERQQRAELVAQAIREVTSIRAASQNLLQLGAGVLDAVPKEEAEVRKRANAADEQWRRESGSIRVWMLVRFGDRYRIAREWDRLSEAASAFNRCAENFYLSSRQQVTHPARCDPEQQALDAALRDFSAAARRAVEQGDESGQR